MPRRHGAMPKGNAAKEESLNQANRKTTGPDGRGRAGEAPVVTVVRTPAAGNPARRPDRCGTTRLGDVEPSRQQDDLGCRGHPGIGGARQRLSLRSGWRPGVCSRSLRWRARTRRGRGPPGVGINPPFSVPEPTTRLRRLDHPACDPGATSHRTRIRRHRQCRRAPLGHMATPEHHGGDAGSWFQLVSEATMADPAARPVLRRQIAYDDPRRDLGRCVSRALPGAQQACVEPGAAPGARVADGSGARQVAPVWCGTGRSPEWSRCVPSGSKKLEISEQIDGGTQVSEYHWGAAARGENGPGGTQVSEYPSEYLSGVTGGSSG